MGDTEFVSKKHRFNPTLSFDGVAIIVACVACSVWFGRLDQRVEFVEKTLGQHAQIIENQSKAISTLSEIIAVIRDEMNRDKRSKQ
jgi:hypothetical protein